MGVEREGGTCRLARAYLLFDQIIETTCLYFLETTQLVPKAADARAVMPLMQHAYKMQL
jgi:hypothetical protein